VATFLNRTALWMGKISVNDEFWLFLA